MTQLMRTDVLLFEQLFANLVSANVAGLRHARRMTRTRRKSRSSPKAPSRTLYQKSLSKHWPKQSFEKFLRKFNVEPHPLLQVLATSQRLMSIVFVPAFEDILCSDVVSIVFQYVFDRGLHAVLKCERTGDDSALCNLTFMSGHQCRVVAHAPQSATVLRVADVRRAMIETLPVAMRSKSLGHVPLLDVLGYTMQESRVCVNFLA
jgi:hypothetical protein